MAPACEGGSGSPLSAVPEDSKQAGGGAHTFPRLSSSEGPSLPPFPMSIGMCSTM